MFTRKDIIKLMVPLIIEQVLAVAIGMADTMMVASCGEAAVSGVSLVDSINVLLINIFSALATGGSIICAQYIGCLLYTSFQRFLKKFFQAQKSRLLRR